MPSHWRNGVIAGFLAFYQTIEQVIIWRCDVRIQSCWGSRLFVMQIASERDNSARPMARGPHGNSLPPRRPVVWMNRVTGWKGLNAYLGAACVEDVTSPTPRWVQERATRLLHCSFNGRLHTVSATHIPTQNVHTVPSLQPLHLHITVAHKHELTSLTFHLSNHNYCWSLLLHLVWSLEPTWEFRRGGKTAYFHYRFSTYKWV